MNMNWKFSTAQDEFLGEKLVYVEAEYNGIRAATTCSAEELDQVVADLERRVKNEPIQEKET